MFCVYVLKSEISGRYYIRSTKDVARRMRQHNAGMMKSTKAYKPWTSVHFEAYNTLSEAMARETQIKAWKSPSYMESALGIIG